MAWFIRGPLPRTTCFFRLAWRYSWPGCWPSAAGSGRFWPPGSCRPWAEAPTFSTFSTWVCLASGGRNGLGHWQIVAGNIWQRSCAPKLATGSSKSLCAAGYSGTRLAGMSRTRLWWKVSPFKAASGVARPLVRESAQPTDSRANKAAPLYFRGLARQRRPQGRVLRANARFSLTLSPS